MEATVQWALDQPLLASLAFAVLMIPLFWFGVYSFRLATRVVQTQQLPPPGTTMRHRHSKSGHAAVWRGRVLQILSVALLLGGGLAVWYLYKILQHFGG